MRPPPDPNLEFEEMRDDPDLPGIRIKGHNFELDVLLFPYRDGRTVDELASWYDSLDIIVKPDTSCSKR